MNSRLCSEKPAVLTASGAALLHPDPCHSHGFGSISNIFIARITGGETASCSNSSWSFCPVQSHLFGWDWASHSKLVGRTCDYLQHWDFTLLYSPFALCTIQTWDIASALQSSQSSETNTTESWLQEHGINCACANICMRFFFLMRGNGERRPFASWHHSILSQSL